MNTTLIIFYSRSGKTKLVAEKLSDILNCEIEEIVDLKNRKGILGFLISGYEAAKEKLTQIKEINKQIDKYNLIILCSPVWADNIPPAVRTFLTNFSKEIKNLGLVITMMGPIGDNKFVSKIKEIVRVQIKFTITIKEKEIISGSYINKLVELKTYEKNKNCS